MSSYFIYILIASATIASPGPGIVMTLTNSLKYGLKNSVTGILGVALAMLVIANIVGGGIGALILKTDTLYQYLKLVGATYLFYLGIKLILNRNKELSLELNSLILDQKKSFYQGFGITLINPKPILFFMALFPQFISNEKEYFWQFIILSLTFCFLIIIIHLIYGLFASIIKKRSKSNGYFKYINILGGSAYILFSISLLLFSKSA